MGERDKFPSDDGHRYGWGGMMLGLALVFGLYFLIVIVSSL